MMLLSVVQPMIVYRLPDMPRQTTLVLDLDSLGLAALLVTS